jgi:hypothetical protein
MRRCLLAVCIVAGSLVAVSPPTSDAQVNCARTWGIDRYGWAYFVVRSSHETRCVQRLVTICNGTRRQRQRTATTQPVEVWWVGCHIGAVTDARMIALRG